MRRFRAVASRLWYSDENVLQMLALPLAVVSAVALLCFGSDEIVSLIMAGGWYKIYHLEQREKGTWRFGRTPAYFFASHACVPSSNAADSAYFFKKYHCSSPLNMTRGSRLWRPRRVKVETNRDTRCEQGDILRHKGQSLASNFQSFV